MLNRQIFYGLAEARVLIEAWRIHDNAVRPHSSARLPTAGPPRRSSRAAAQSRRGRGPLLLGVSRLPTRSTAAASGQMHKHWVPDHPAGQANPPSEGRTTVCERSKVPSHNLVVLIGLGWLRHPAAGG